MSLETLPLPADILPASIQRFANPDAPKPGKMMAARGMVPVKGADLLTLLAQLSADPDQDVSAGAKATLLKLPENVVQAGCSDPQLLPPVADALADHFETNDSILTTLIEAGKVSDHKLASIARGCTERVSEVIALNQNRLLGAPEIVEALYKNRNTRMSTADRLVELCARNGVQLQGIASFEAHVQAISGQLIPEPTEEPLPTDEIFSEVLEFDEGEDALEIDRVDGSEELKEKFKPLSFRIRNMTNAEKIRLCIVGDAAARSILVRDPNKLISYAAISSPSMTENEAGAIAKSKEIGEDILRYIGNKKDWLGSYEIKRALVMNPKTPVGISMRFLGHLRTNDLKALSRSRGVPNALKTAAKQRLQKKGI